MRVSSELIAAFVAGGAAFAALLFAVKRKKPQPPAPPPIIPKGEIQNLIVREAERQGVEPRIALTFVDLESRFTPSAVGDADWPHRVRKNGQTNHEKWVLNNPVFDNNPWRSDPDVWVSYGLFQLLSPHHLSKHNPNAHPAELLDPKTNAKIGIGIIKRMVNKYGEDWVKVRLGYGGTCMIPGRCSYETIERIVGRLDARTEKWGLDLGPDPIGYGWEVAQGLAQWLYD